MENKELNFNGTTLNGFMVLFLNLIVVPALIALDIIFWGDNKGLSIPIAAALFIVFIVLMPGYFSQEPNEARAMVFFGKYKGTCKETGFFLGEPFHGQEKTLFKSKKFRYRTNQSK